MKFQKGLLVRRWTERVIVTKKTKTKTTNKPIKPRSCHGQKGADLMHRCNRLIAMWEKRVQLYSSYCFLGSNKGVSQIRMHLPRLYFERWAVLFSKKLPNMSTGIALLLTLISYTQNPTGWVYATGNYLSVIQGLSNLQPWETLNSTARLFWAVIFIIDGHLWHCYSCIYCQ